MSKRVLLSFVLLMLVTTACQLSAAPPIPPTATSTPWTNPVTPTFIVPPSNTPPGVVPTVPTATSTRAAGSNPTPCFVRSDWRTYVVQAGDTLSRLAARIGTTAAALAVGNCLTSADTIYVGQALRLPLLPPVPSSPTPTLTPTPTVTATLGAPPPDQIGGQVGISSFLSANGGLFNLLRNDTVQLNWEFAPAGMIREARFYLMPPTIPDSFISNYEIGVDTNPNDGVGMVWSVPPGLYGERLIVRAQFINAPGYAVSNAVFVYSAPPPGQGCTVTNIDSAPIQAFWGEPTSRQTGDQLLVGQSVELLGRAVNGWYAINLGASVGVTPPVQWLPVDAIINLSGARC